MAVRLDGIEPEVVQIILEYVHETSPHTSKSVARVNKFLHAALKVVINRRKTLRLANFLENQQSECPWQQDDEILRSIRHLTIEKAWKDSGVPTKNCQPLADLIRRISKLKILVWNAGPIPKIILDALSTMHATAKLRIFHWWREDEYCDQLTEDEAALAKFRNLTHLRAAPVRYTGIEADEAEYSAAVLRYIVENSPSLYYAGMIRSIHDNSHEAFLLLDEAGITSKRRSCSVRSLMLDCPRMMLDKTTLELLDRFIDISRLEIVKFSRGVPKLDYFENAATMLPNLKDVSLNLLNAAAWSEASTIDATLSAARFYLATAPPLRSLSLWGWTRVACQEQTQTRDPRVRPRLVADLSFLLRRHGASLETLQLHERDVSAGWSEYFLSHPYDRRHVLHGDDVQSIRLSCPNLSEFTFDMNRENAIFNLFEEKENEKILDKVSQFGSRLKRLNIYFETEGLCRSLYGSVTQESESEQDSEYEEDIEEVDSGADGDDAGQDGDEAAAQASVDSHPLIDLTSDDNNIGILSPRKYPPTTRSDTKAKDKNVVQQLERPESTVKNYVAQIWKRVFGHHVSGERILEVKFGEWEGKSTWYGEYDPRLFLEAQPHERDDRQGECFVKCTWMRKPSRA